MYTTSLVLIKEAVKKELERTSGNVEACIALRAAGQQISKEIRSKNRFPQANLGSTISHSLFFFQDSMLASATRATPADTEDLDAVDGNHEGEEEEGGEDDDEVEE